VGIVAGRLTRGLVLVAVPAMVALAGGPAGAERAEPVVTAAVQVTTNPNPTRAHSSPQMARNPKTGELVVVETDVYGGFGVNVHVSTDNGRSWFPGGDPMMKPYTWTSDYAINGPYFTLAYDRDAVLSIAFSATDPKAADVNRTQRPRSVFLARSGDGGRSFTTSFVYRAQADNPKTLNNRRAMVTVDPQNPANVYVDWIQSTSGEKSRSMVAASADGGKSFREPVGSPRRPPSCVPSSTATPPTRAVPGPRRWRSTPATPASASIASTCWPSTRRPRTCT